MKNQTTIYITDQELISLLQIDEQKLVDTETILDSNNIFNNQDYIIINNDGKREYTQIGAEKIASYLDKNLVVLVKHWFSKREQEISISIIRDHIIDNVSSLILHNNQHFISTLDLINILQTEKDILNMVVLEAKHTQDDPLSEEKDYYIEIDHDGNQEFYFSETGISKIVFCLKKRLKKEKDKLYWVKTSGNIFKTTINDIIEKIKKRQKNINSAKNKAKTRDKKTCQVTNVKNEKDEITKRFNDNKIKFVAHHLYSQNNYPHLADSIDNLITITETVHNNFHCNYMGSYNNPCTIDDFIQFVKKYYPDNIKVIMWLKDQKGKLQSKPKPHIFNQNPQRFLPPSYR